MSPPRVSGGAFRVGTALGIPIRIHFTFFLLLLWFGMGSASTGEGFLTGVVFILLLFGCVVLHELGHAAMARRFGVETREIVLYPIGGVARLDRIPSGKAELLIALAGPAVNLILLLAGLGIAGLGALLGSAAMVAMGAVWPALYLIVLGFASGWMVLRHRSPCGLWAGPALAAMHLPWGAGFLSGLFKENLA